MYVCILTEEHHGDVTLEPLPSNNAHTSVRARILAAYRRDVQLAHRLSIPLHVHSALTHLHKSC